MNLTKNEQIRKTLIATRLRRKSQKCSVFELKIDFSKLAISQRTKLKMYFVAAKWLYNHLVTCEDVFKFDYKTVVIPVMNKDKVFEDRELKNLPAKTRQDILNTTKQNIKALSSLKKKGKRVGRLSCKSSYNSIDLSQEGTTHKITGKNKIRIGGIKKHMQVNGLQQITSDYEIANAKLIRRASGFYVKITCFRFIQNSEFKNTGKNVGLDFGIKTNVTTSDGEEFNCTVGETDRLKRLQRKLFKAKKGSNNRYKIRLLIQKEYEDIDNKKKDKANKLVSYLLNHYDNIYMQDENLKGWHKGLFRKQVQHSYLGSVKAKLKKSKQTMIIDRFLPTTKLCYRCGVMVGIGLEDRVFKCPCCGLTEDRDIKSAKTVLYFGRSELKHVPTGRRIKPVETTASAIRKEVSEGR